MSETAPFRALPLLAALTMAMAGACLFEVPGIRDGAYRCATDADCVAESAFRCGPQGVCVGTGAPALVDGGARDAGRSDGGTAPDDGARDAGADAGLSDAGPPDGGPRDDAGIDAGPDGGPGDAGPSVCGDAVLEGTEECDDGNTDDRDACTSACRSARCGDGFVQPSLGETCDDGNASAGDGCDDECDVESDMRCEGAPSYCAEADLWIEVPGDAETVSAALGDADDGSVLFLRAAGSPHVARLDLNNRQLVLVGEPGAVLLNNSDGGGGATLDVHGDDADIEVYGLVLQNERTGGNDHAVRVRDAARVKLVGCTLGPTHQHGVSVENNNATFTLLRSVVSGCSEGGLVLQGAYDVRHNFVFDNGSGAATFGGATLVGGSGTFAFNTVVGNQAEAGSPAGVRCEAQDAPVRANLLEDNGADALDGDCLAVDNALPDARAGNFSFGQSCLVGGGGLEGLRLAPGSPCIDALPAPGAVVDVDFDGQPRPLRGGLDVGADEVP